MRQLHRRNDVLRKSAIEGLESRRLLAACEIDPQPGDANRDCFIDMADWVQVMKFDKRPGDPATWEEGDWNGDGVWTSDDLTLVFHNGWFEQGMYDDRGTVPVNELRPISTSGPADASLYYFAESGRVAVVADGEIGIRALHIVSQSSSINDDRGPRIWDRASESYQLVNSRKIPGAKMIEFTHLLPSGWTEQQVLDDLLIDGAIAGGGDLGNVQFGNTDEFPLEHPEEDKYIRVPDKPTFVGADKANGLLTYDPDTGDVFIESWELPMYHVQLTSPSGLLVGTELSSADRYAPRLFDTANPKLFNRIAIDADVVFVDGVPDVGIFTLPGFHTVNLPEIAEVGLTEAEFLADIQPEGQLDPTGSLKLAFTIGRPFGLCRELIEHGTVIGDANQDGRLNSQDLVTVFQANEYRDEQEDNSTWSEGDWTCDGDFDTDDLVAAFQSGQYEQPVAAIAAGLNLDRGRSFRVNYDVDHCGVTDVTKARTHGTLATNRRWLSEIELVHMPQVHSEMTLRLNEQSLVHADAVNRDLVDIALGDEFYFLWPE